MTVRHADWVPPPQVLCVKRFFPGAGTPAPHPAAFPGNLTHVGTRLCSIPRLNRASQTYFFPVHLTDQLLPSAVFYATVGPLVVYFALHRLVIRPYLRAQKEK